jgi:hypothetical protein
MLARNGERPATEWTVNGARKFSGIGNGKTSKPTAEKTQPVAPDTRPGGKSSAIHVSGPRRPRPVIAVLNARWRVVCENSVQWILQCRGGNQWQSRYFCRTRAGLVACVHEYAGPIGGDALVVLLRLPEWIGGVP